MTPFFNVVAFTDKNTDVNTYLPLRIDIDKGVDVSPDMSINVTSLNKSETSRYNHFFNNGYAGINFTVEVWIKETDMFNGKPVLEQLHEWFTDMTPLDVVTSAIDVPDGEYLITKNAKRKQSQHKYTNWELEFTSYTPLTLIRYANNNQAVLNAINKTKTAKKSATNNKLKKCNYKTLKYSKKKKIVKCVKYMQKILYKKGHLKKKYVTGWFDKNTKTAVKKFQKKYNKQKLGSNAVYATSGTLITNDNVNMDYLDTSNPDVENALNVKTSAIGTVTKVLPTNGKVDKATWKALCEA